MKKLFLLLLVSVGFSVVGFASNGKPAPIFLRKIVVKDGLAKGWKVSVKKESVAPICELEFYQGLNLANNYLYYGYQACGNNFLCAMDVYLNYQQMTLVLEVQLNACERMFIYPI